MLDSIWNLVTLDIGIDLGTANTLVHVAGKGIMINEPSVVAVNKKTKEVLAVGNDARQMIGRTPANVVAVRPLKDGIITDFDTTQAMIRYFIERVHELSAKFLKIPRPRVVMGVPSSVTEVERQAVVDAAKSAGARTVYIVEEAIAAAIGVGLPIEDPSGSMIVDVGGGTTDVAVLSLGGIVVDKTLQIAGDEMNQDIINYVRHKYNLLVGERSAEDVKISIGSAYPQKEERAVVLQGRDLISGLPKAIEITSVEVREALMNSLSSITDAIKDAVEETPPELLADLATSGVTLAGGGSQLRGLDRFWKEKLKLPVIVADDPMTAVARGTAKLLERVDLLKKAQSSWDEII
ncbi:rod shape-determining protein [Candidatus Dojkabacteria bacterium]|nr:rod shape-determining protein [Candidatus Dojkabacteria bacterium]